MLTAMIFVCLLGAAPNLADCSMDNAVYVMPVPGEFASPVTCFLHGQSYLAETSIGRNLAPKERMKVVCVMNGPLIEARRHQD